MKKNKILNKISALVLVAISVTMNTYTHVKFQDAQEDFQKAINS